MTSTWSPSPWKRSPATPISRITEALLQDDRITAVDSWEFETGRNWVLARFVAHTIFGEVEAEKEVAI